MSFAIRLEADLRKSKDLATMQFFGATEIVQICEEMKVFLGSTFKELSGNKDVEVLPLPPEGDNVEYCVKATSFSFLANLCVKVAVLAFQTGPKAKKFRYKVYQEALGQQYNAEIGALKNLSKTAEGAKYHVALDARLSQHLENELRDILARAPHSQMDLWTSGAAFSSLLVGLFWPIEDSLFTFTSYPSAIRLDIPRPERNLAAICAEKTLTFGPLQVTEAPVILSPAHGRTWQSSRVSWVKHRYPFSPHPIWHAVDKYDPIQTFADSDRVLGKHIRLAAAGLMRDAERSDLGFVWQPLSWEQSWRTNGRISRGVKLDGHPIWSWFDENDLIVPPLESDTGRYDPPFGNRFAINLSVILKSIESNQEFAIVQKRPSDLAFSPNKYEFGVSESVHGDAGWSQQEIDVADGVPSLKRTALRCLWQELGIAENGEVNAQIPTFDVEIAFTALVLNKLELVPRLTGFAVVRGGLTEFEKANRMSGESPVSHKEFGIRKVKDAVPWDRVHWLDATPSGLAWVLQQWRFDSACALTPECRACLILYLWHRLGKSEAEKQFLEGLRSCKRPAWWDASTTVEV